MKVKRTERTRVGLVQMRCGPSPKENLGRAIEGIREAAGRGIQVIICGAGAAAHLAGVVAAESELPVLGVPLASSDLKGLDALLATVQMPAGVPVGTLAIGKGGARNAGLLAARIIARGDPALAERVRAARLKMASDVEAKDAALQARLK